MAPTVAWKTACLQLPPYQEKSRMCRGCGKHWETAQSWQNDVLPIESNRNKNNSDNEGICHHRGRWGCVELEYTSMRVLRQSPSFVDLWMRSVVSGCVGVNGNEIQLLPVEAISESRLWASHMQRWWRSPLLLLLISIYSGCSCPALMVHTLFGAQMLFSRRYGRWMVRCIRRWAVNSVRNGVVSQVVRSKAIVTVMVITSCLHFAFQEGLLRNRKKRKTKNSMS